MDSLTPGRGNGSILLEAVKEAGADGVLLNHAEKRLPLDIIGDTIKRAQEIGLVSMVASSNPKDAENLADLGPEVVIAKSPDRIGNLKSVGRDREFVVQSVKRVKAVDPNILFICGGDVKSGRDVAGLVKLGV